MAYQSNLLGDFWQGYRQRRIGTGLPLSQNEMGGLLNPILDTNARMADDAARREQQQSQLNQQMNLRKDEVANQRVTGMVGGVTQAAMLPLAYGAGKSMGWWGGNTAPVAPTTAPGGLLGGQSLVSPAAAATTTAQGGLAPTPAMDTLATAGNIAPNLMAVGNAPTAPAAGMSPLAAGGTAAGLYAGQVALGNAVQPTMDKIGMPMTGKGFTYGGLPGAFAGGAYDAINKISSLF